ncbi:small integral membrane protein 26-like [Sebastes umbrosus]|uniref:small integral membrane protein 26-like n=1 Tax=Sebastes umbrosus TaxID=72105 RepID=UPI0018A02CB7|nr:small integral membrane protein 26-like [Sebastes umbrosus]XP_037621646.1 small integral membrane protein 26-like [Sebastes umbrosus]
MNYKDLAKWNVRVAAVYAVGIWTMIGSYTLFRYTGRYEDPPVKKEEKVEEPEDPNKVVYETLHSKTTIQYKKDFVPYSTRVYNFIKSFSGEPGRGDSDK